MRRFDSVLVANRGEIALRIMGSVRKAGMGAVGVYSEIDAAAPHVAFADQAVEIGPSPPAQSYLNIDKLIAAAKATGAGAIHPGYGFLSENAEFARTCEKSGIVFIGPSAEAIELMGNKATAKQLMIAAGVPCVPGYAGEDQTKKAFTSAAAKIGFPVMVKAAAGGGGRGMRLVTKARELADALALARSEAKNAFGSGELILEKAIADPRHVEIQVFGDNAGTIIHLGERDCSVQRRHQKVIEEAPSPAVDAKLRQRMGEAAVAAARATDYCNAGTVEFLLAPDGEFFFLEMNTRLQVEHPVTEAVTGIDLVELQLRVANGEPLGLTQDDIDISGHAIEVRLYAEDPANGFLPASGRVAYWRQSDNARVRTDTGIAAGSEVSPYYDPMLAKIIAHGRDRDEARQLLICGIKETSIFGLRSNRDFLIRALAKPAFRDGKATTAFIEQHISEADIAGAAPGMREAACAALLAFLCERDRLFAASTLSQPTLLNWSNSGALHWLAYLSAGETKFELTVMPVSADRYQVADGQDVLDIRVTSRAANDAILEIDGLRARIAFCQVAPIHLELTIDGTAYEFARKLAASESAGRQVAGNGLVLAPTHANVVEVYVTKGMQVAKGARLLVLEAMKMQQEIVADIAGTVSQCRVEAGNQVAMGAVLVEITAPAPAE